MNQKHTFSEYKRKYDKQFGTEKEIDCFLTVHLKQNCKASLRKKNGQKNEEYYKWQFLYAIVYSGMYPKDYIGTEIHLPKGNKNSASLKIDAVVFDDNNWFEQYQKYHLDNDMAALDWLRQHLVVAIEFKKENAKDIATVWNKQLKAYLKESEREFSLGVLYDTERLYLFKKHQGKLLRYSDAFNTKGPKSTTKDLNLHLPDPYANLPNFNESSNWTAAKDINRAKRTIHDLDIISTIHSIQVNDVMSTILRTMDKQGMVNQKGFEILIQILALKIFDEKKNEKNKRNLLKFYITDEEQQYETLASEDLQIFLKRISKLRENAVSVYHKILRSNPLDTRNENHIKVLIEVIRQFQDYSFVRSHKTDLYQLVFYKFATPFAKDQNAQFVTPLPLIDFLVNIVNPRNGETIIDPTVGIADFLSVSYVNSNSRLDDKNIFGMDIDEQMVMLATLNMLLNGDGNAKIKAKAGYGSLLTKFDYKGDMINLVPSMNQNGNWDNRPDNNKIMKFDVVLTNPPFGEDRAFEPKDEKDKEVIECYELWHRYDNRKIDLGVIFLENAYRILKTNGRLGIVLSNSIASIDSHAEARRWLMEKMRIVAIFDLPPNVFAETGVNTSIIVAYKPEEKELNKLKKQNYQVFFKNIEKVGYEVKTKKRVKKFETKYKISYENFKLLIDSAGEPIVDEEFTETTADFKEWCKSQEKTLQELFIAEK